MGSVSNPLHGVVRAGAGGSRSYIRTELECGVASAGEPVHAHRTVAVEVLVESGFEGSYRRAGTGRRRHRARDVVAVAVRVPDRILIGPDHLPDDLIAAADLLRADRSPGARLV